jgi:hypothetical protein
MGNMKEKNDPEITQSLLQNYQKLGRLMSLKTPFLPSHLSFFPEHPDAVSGE